MSMEIRVFFAGPLPPPAALAAAMAGFDLRFRLAEPETPLDDASGFVPMTYSAGEDAEETGCEVYLGPAAETISEFAITGIDPALNREIALRWGGDALEGASACALAAAVTHLTGGTIYDDAAGAITTIDAARRAANELIALADAGG